MTKQDINDFIEYCGITATKTTLHKINHKIVYIDSYFNGKLNTLEIKDIHKFLSDLNKTAFAISTKNDFIKSLKRFLKWRYKDWNTRFEEFKDLKSNSNDQRKLSKEDLLTPDEMQMIINVTESLKYKTILLLFQETAGRPEEILKLTWKEINMDKREVNLHSSKTGKTRTIPINNTIEHLKRYKVECFYETPKINDKVFGITSQAVSNYLAKVEYSLNLNKHLFPYLYRHSILTAMIKKLTPKSYEMFAGHSLETGMKIYAHLDNDDLRQELNEKVYHLEKITREETERIKELEKEMKNKEKNYLMLLEKWELWKPCCIKFK